MKEKYYISSNKYSLVERQTKNYGKVYDVVFRIVDSFTLQEKQKKLSGYKTKTLAKEAYTAFITEKCELRKNVAIRVKSPQKIDLTVEDVLPKYISTLYNQNRESTIYDRIKCYNAFVLPTLSKIKIKNLTKSVLKEWQDNLWISRNTSGKLYSYEYLSKIRMHLSAFLSYLEEVYNIPNALRQVRKPKRLDTKREMKIWTVEEFNRFISCVDKPIYHCLFTMMFYTGRRKGEILALKPENINPHHSNKIIFNSTYSRKTLTPNSFTITSTKNKKIGESPIPTPLKNELQTYKGDSPFFFGGEKPLHENTASHAFQHYIEKSGVTKIRMHDLRHSFVSMLIHLGATIPVVADLIGDTIPQVTKTYAHLYESDKASVISKIF